MRSRWIAALGLVLAATLAAGCLRKSEPPATGEVQDPSGQPGDPSGQNGTGGGPEGAGPGGAGPGPAPPPVQTYLRQGLRSPDGLWLAALVPPEAGPEAAGLWVAAGTGSQQPVRIAQAVSYQSGGPIWTPRGELVFPGEDGWRIATPPDWRHQPFLPQLLAGREVLLRADAFSPDGSQFVYTVVENGRKEVWLASTAGQNLRHLGTDVVANWVEGTLVVGPEWK